MPNNKKKRPIVKAVKQKNRVYNMPPNQNSQLKLLEARREELRSSSMPEIETLSEVQETNKSRPRSAEDGTRSNNVKLKTLLQCMLAGEWTSALGRMSNLEEKSPELSQSNVNI